MDFILLIFLSAVFLPDIISLQPIVEQDPGVMLSDEEQYYEDKENKTDGESANLRKLGENEDDAPAKQKVGNYYKDTKQFVFTTPSENSEISVTATTDLKFAMRNKAGKPTVSGKEEKPNELSPSTPNVPAFWTMLAKVINETAVSMDDKDLLFQPIPASDLNTTNEDQLSELEELKLKLMLGISLMTLILLIPLLIFCFATLYKLSHLRDKSSEGQYSVNPELATLSYFHPSEGSNQTVLTEESSFLPPEGTSFFPPEETNFLPPEGTRFLPPEETTFRPPEEPGKELIFESSTVQTMSVVGEEVQGPAIVEERITE